MYHGKLDTLNQNNPDVTYYAYNVEHDSYTQVTREADPNEEYDGDDQQTDWTIGNKITLANDANCDVVAPFKALDGETLYLVYAIYGTGDSFSYDDNGCCDFIALYKTRAKAEALVAKITAENENKKEQPMSMTYQDEAGQMHRILCGWNGYFETLTTCEVKEVALPALDFKQKMKKFL